MKDDFGILITNIKFKNKKSTKADICNDLQKQKCVKNEVPRLNVREATASNNLTLGKKTQKVDLPSSSKKSYLEGAETFESEN